MPSFCELVEDESLLGCIIEGRGKSSRELLTLSEFTGLARMLPRKKVPAKRPRERICIQERSCIAIGIENPFVRLIRSTSGEVINRS